MKRLSSRRVKVLSGLRGKFGDKGCVLALVKNCTGKVTKLFQCLEAGSGKQIKPLLITKGIGCKGCTPIFVCCTWLHGADAVPLFNFDDLAVAIVLSDNFLYQPSPFWPVKYLELKGFCLLVIKLPRWNMQLEQEFSAIREYFSARPQAMNNILRRSEKIEGVVRDDDPVKDCGKIYLHHIHADPVYVPIVIIVFIQTFPGSVEHPGRNVYPVEHSLSADKLPCNPARTASNLKNFALLREDAVIKIAILPV